MNCCLQQGAKCNRPKNSLVHSKYDLNCCNITNDRDAKCFHVELFSVMLELEIPKHMSRIKVPNLVPSGGLRNEGGAVLTWSWPDVAHEAI